MVAIMSSKELWIHVRSFGKLSTEDVVTNDVVCISVPTSLTTQQLRKHIFQQLNLERLLQDDPTVVCKLRDSQGALIPLSMNLLGPSDPSRPFVLEVVNVHQNVPAGEWKVPALHRENVKERIQRLNDRVDEVELKLDELSANYSHNLEEELKSLTIQTNVLKRILKEMGRQ